MAIERDFDVLVPDQALSISDSELYPLFRDYLERVGISDPSRYDHYQIRITIRSRYSSERDEKAGVFDFLRPTSWKKKRRSFASADSLFVLLEFGDPSIVLREAYPPTTYEDGQPELSFMGKAEIGGGVNVAGAKATANIQASMRKEFKHRKFSIVSQRGHTFAWWDFKRHWIIQGSQPELHITCSVPNDLPDNARYVKCQRRVSDGGRVLLAPPRAKRIRLPRPVHN